MKGIGIKRKLLLKTCLSTWCTLWLQAVIHSFDKWKVFAIYERNNHILRLLKYPKGNAGLGFGVYLNSKLLRSKIGVLNLQVVTLLKRPIDDPFTASRFGPSS